MKVPYNFLKNSIKNSVSIEELSNVFFQLGHEHTIQDNIFDFELTPNRGDCLSLQGLLRDLNSIHSTNRELMIYDDTINDLDLGFNNLAPEDCPKISFLKIELDNKPNIAVYQDYLESFFTLLGNKKVNFFTDISNYISFELGQPTHCYDNSKINNEITLERSKKNLNFKSLLGDEIKLSDSELIFSTEREAINLAGIMGGESTMCSKDTKSVLIECAFFNPESIIGKSIKYDLKSDAAHKFERYVDPLIHEKALRRFIYIVNEHIKIKNISMTSFVYDDYKQRTISNDLKKINNILGTNIYNEKFQEILSNLGFNISNNSIEIPSWRSDINSLNDIAEEIARVIGYDNITKSHLSIQKTNDSNIKDLKEIKIIELLINNGFNEIINFPFTEKKSKNAVRIDNPIDTTKPNMRESLEDSLLDNLIYNERRQQDIIKLFEISDLYSISKNEIKKKRNLGVIGSGRVDRNFRNFNKKIDKSYFDNIFSKYIKDIDNYLEEISREKIRSKLKSKIIYFEINIDEIHDDICAYESFVKKPTEFSTLKEVSEYPSIFRDLSFSIKDFTQISKLEKLIMEYSHEHINDVFIFDYFHNEKNSEVKIGFRFRFKANKTLTDLEVDKIINDIIDAALNLDEVTVPGLVR